jgi:putative membrane protein
LSARRLRAGLDDRHLVTTRGVLTTTTDVVPLAKVQSLRLTSGPWQQRLRLATLHADTAGRRLPGGQAHHRDVEEGRALLGELALRTRAARRAGHSPSNAPTAA